MYIKITVKDKHCKHFKITNFKIVNGEIFKYNYSHLNNLYLI